MDVYLKTEITNKFLYLESILKKDAVLEFLIELEKNGGGDISVTQVLDFLEKNNININRRKKVISSL